MNTKGFTLIELITTVAIILILASVAAPAYSTVLQGSKESVDDTSLLVLNDATNAYAMLNDMELSDVFDGIGTDNERMAKLVDENYLSSEVSPAQEGESFQWNAESLKWTLSNGGGSSDSGDTGDTGDTGGTSDDESGTGGEDEDTGSGDAGGSGGHGHGHGHGWKYSKEHGWEWYDEDGNKGEGDDHYEYYGYGSGYDEGTKVWYNGDYYISQKNTDSIPGQNSDWQKICDDWYEHNSYSEGDVVTYNGSQYRATKDSNGKNPETKGSHWEKIS